MAQLLKGRLEVLSIQHSYMRQQELTYPGSQFTAISASYNGILCETDAQECVFYSTQQLFNSRSSATAFKLPSPETQEDAHLIRYDSFSSEEPVQHSEHCIAGPLGLFSIHDGKLFCVPAALTDSLSGTTQVFMRRIC